MKRDERLPPLLAAFLGAESDAADAPRTGGARFLRFPGTGGGWVLLDAANPAVFRAGTALLPRGRFVTRLATRVVGASARVGLHGRFARARVAAARVVDPAERFPGLPRGLACNAASGVPGRDQKTIVQLVSPNGRVVAFAKVADSLAARALVRREHDALAQLAIHGVHVPRVLGFEDAERATVLVQSALHGGRAPAAFGAAHAAFLAELTERTRVEFSATDLPAHRSAHARLAALASVPARPGVSATTPLDRAGLETYAELARVLEEHERGDRVACSFAHGDFTPWNAVLGPDGLGAFDWEHALDAAPLGHDALHFVLQHAILVERVPHAALAAHARARLAPYAARLFPAGFERALAHWTLDLGLRDELREREHPSPFVQAGWQRSARLELAAHAVRRLARKEHAA